VPLAGDSVEQAADRVLDALSDSRRRRPAL
jgi:hypothetical protein